MFGDILEPLLAFLAAGLPFAEVSRLAVVSEGLEEGVAQCPQDRASAQSERVCGVR